jgi:hypothetical protein
MAVRFGLWRLDGDAVAHVAPSVISSEDRLESVLEKRMDILGLGRLLVLGRQVITRTGKRVDLLAMDAKGDLHVVELKKDRTPRDVVAQALEYGYWASALSFDDVRDLYALHHDGADLSSDFATHFEAELPDAVNTEHHLVVVATRLDTSTEQIVEYVRAFGVPLNVLLFQYLQDGDREYLARSWLGEDVELSAPARRSKKQEVWNGLDYFTAIGESEHRNWDDMVTYGFVSAGHGEKYRKAMANLSEGSRVWACIPGHGYVGVGEVVAPAVPVTEFMVDMGGAPTAILDAPHHAQNMDADAGDPELCEYLARVRWIETRDRKDALWEKGMFANQNVVAKLRQAFTLQRLAEEFRMDDRPDPAG